MNTIIYPELLFQLPGIPLLVVYKALQLLNLVQEKRQLGVFNHSQMEDHRLFVYVILLCTVVLGCKRAVRRKHPAVFSTLMLQKRALTQPCWYPEIGLSASGTVRKKCLWFIRPPVCGNVFRLPERTETGISNKMPFQLSSVSMSFLPFFYM